MPKYEIISGTFREFYILQVKRAFGLPELSNGTELITQLIFLFPVPSLNE